MQRERQRQAHAAPEAAPLVAPEPGAALRTPATADLDAARRVVLMTSAVALVAGIGIEWAGWQIIFRHSTDFVASGRTLMGIPVAQWAFGAMRNTSAAIGIGVGAAALSMLWPRAWRHPWRTLAAAFAVGTAATLVALGALTAWAP